VPNSEPVPPRRNGTLFPLAVNLVGVAVAVVVIVLSLFLFRVRRDQLESAAAGPPSAEGMILAEFKREAEEKIREKDTAIVRVLRQLTALEREREQLARIMQLRIQDKEREMRQSLESELAARRGELSAAGLSAAQVDEHLLEFESSKKREMFDLLEAFQAELDALTYEKEQELIREKARARLALEKVTVEREELLQETHKQEAILLDQLRPEDVAPAAASSAVAALTEKETMGAQERLILDQIAGIFLAVGNQAVTGRYDAAARGLDSLEAILRDPKISALPAVQRRKASDLMVVKAFRGLLAASTTQRTAAEGGSAIPAADGAELREQVATLEGDLRRKEAELSRLQVEARTQAGTAAPDPDAIAEEARTAAFRDLLEAVGEFGEGPSSSAASLGTLRDQLARTQAQRSLVERILKHVDDLASQAAFAAAGSGRAYRILGTVTSVGPERLTILPIVNLPVQAGAPVEIRRVLEAGTTLRIARGTVVEAQGEKIIARVDAVAGKERPVITDKVYLIED
jgi:hypothetical protein